MLEGPVAVPAQAVRPRLPMGATLPFEAINSPGAYVCNWNGHLLRIPARTLVPGDALHARSFGLQPLLVTKISDDPGLTLAEARALASRLGMTVDF